MPQVDVKFDYEQKHVVITIKNDGKYPELEDVKRAYCQAILEACDNNKSRAAHVLNICLRTLRLRINETWRDHEGTE